MPQQTINVGTVGNDNTGDPNRTAFQKCQANFTELYTASSGYQPVDADLTSLAAASATNTLYYRSAAGVWSPVTIGAGLAFSGGVLAVTGTGIAGTLSATEAGVDVGSFTGAIGTDPISIFGADLVAWWDAADGLSSGVAADRSGNGHPLTASGAVAPTAAGSLNGFPSYAFGIADLGTGGLRAGSPGSLSFPGLGAAGAVFAVISINSVTQSYARIFSSDVAADDVTSLNSWNGEIDLANHALYTVANSVATGTTSVWAADENFVACFAFDSGNIYLYKNNVQVSTTTSVGGTMNVGGGAGGGSTTFTLGNLSVGTLSTCLAGLIGAAFVVKRLPSSGDRLLAYNYLKNKFGL